MTLYSPPPFLHTAWYEYVVLRNGFAYIQKFICVCVCVFLDLKLNNLCLLSVLYRARRPIGNNWTNCYAIWCFQFRRHRLAHIGSYLVHRTILVF